MFRALVGPSSVLDERSPFLQKQERFEVLFPRGHATIYTVIYCI